MEREQEIRRSACVVEGVGEGAASSCVGEELLSFVEIEVWTAIVRVPQRLEVMRNDFHNLHQVGKR